MLGWEAWFTLVCLATMVVALVRDVARPDIILVGTLGLLLLVGIVPSDEAFLGFANSAVIAVGSLFVVAAGLQKTQSLSFLDHILFGQSTRPAAALPRLMLPTSILSAFLNNTPIVAMFLPRVQEWAERKGVSPSKYLIPLSYSAILGGMITLIGTSTNVVVSGMMEDAGLGGMGMFQLTVIGLPAALVVMVFFVVVGHRLLPDKKGSLQEMDDGLRACVFEVRVAAESPFAGKTIEESDLRALGDAYLIHIRHSGRIIPASRDHVLDGGDVLTFSGKVEILDELLERPGLERTIDSVDYYGPDSLPLFEAVVAETSTIVGKTLKECDFRDRFGGVVLALQRKDESTMESLGSMRIRAGDLLVIESVNGFAEKWNSRREDFYLVSPRRAGRARPVTRKAPIAMAILTGMVVSVATGFLPLVTATFSAALGMIATGCLRFSESRRAVDVTVLVVIGAALGIGRAVEQTGLAELLAAGLTSATMELGTIGLLGGIYITTNLLTEMITHKAAAVLMFPVAISAAARIDAEPTAFALVVAVAAAASFMTPIGYQTNLMVMAAGQYRYRDYIRIGIPVSLLVMAVTLTVVALVWL